MKNTGFLLAATLLLTGCAGLPRSLRQEIAQESDKVEQANKQLQRTSATIREDLAKKPDLFKGTRVESEWPARLGVAKNKLDRAGETRRAVEKLHAGDRHTVQKAEALLADERRLRQAALDDVAAVEGEATRWLDFQRNLPHYLAQMQREHDQIRTLDTAPLSKVVEKAERDWPAKKADLDSRLNAIRSAPERAEQQWQATETARQDAGAGKATGAQIATLIEADNTLADASTDLTRHADELKALSAQLYDSWDKILEDLEATRQGQDTLYREKVKTVRTHFDDVADKQTETSSDVKWVDVSPATYRSAEHNLGMAIAHKDAGRYDSEAQTIAQPPGFAYIAPPDVGRNQYGYWTHNQSGSFWTFFPQYLIMRELLWGRGAYQPVVVNEYNSYYAARGAGRTYYGQDTPAAAPKYGSHGTFTQQRYSNSRYVQSGSYKSSAFASRPVAPATPATPRYSGSPNNDGQGKRFGRPSDELSPGHRFGSGGGSPGEQPPAGRRFGSGSERSASPPGRRFGSGGSSPRPAPRAAPRSFGRRR